MSITAMTQPKALQLAEALERYDICASVEAMPDLDVVAAELRRLHALNAELVECLAWYVANDDVIESMTGNEYWVEGLHKAQAALAKAGETK